MVLQSRPQAQKHLHYFYVSHFICFLGNHFEIFPAHSFTPVISAQLARLLHRMCEGESTPFGFFSFSSASCLYLNSHHSLWDWSGYRSLSHLPTLWYSLGFWLHKPSFFAFVFFLSLILAKYRCQLPRAYLFLQVAISSNPIGRALGRRMKG